jgi:hypothetical protein
MPGQRKLVEQAFGWIKTASGTRKTRYSDLNTGRTIIADRELSGTREGMATVPLAGAIAEFAQLRSRPPSAKADDGIWNGWRGV